MAASPGAAEFSTNPPSPFLDPATPPVVSSGTKRCRLCARETCDAVDIFSEAGRERGLPEKVRLCLPVLVTEQDELSKSVCLECTGRLETVRAFFETCFNANQELLISHRKVRPSPLDLPTHINQFVRSFNAPTVPQIKIEPSNYLDVDLGLDEAIDDKSIIPLENGEAEEYNYNNSYLDEEDLEEDEFDDEDDSFLFKVPSVPRKKKKRRGRPRKYNPDGSPFDPYFDDPTNAIKGQKPHKKQLLSSASSNRGRKKIVPMALKTCSMCGEQFGDHAGNLAHWKDKHPDQEVVYKCTEMDRTREEEMCDFSSKESEEMFKHRVKHKHSTKEVDIKPEKMVDCKICGKYYTPSYLVNRHVLVHSDRKDFKCGVCGKDFKTSNDLKIHIHTHDPDDLRYTHCCELCGKRFTQRANLDAHLRVHSGYKPYSCDICGKSFSQKGNMEEHRRVHTGERPYVCELCGTSFVRRSEMALHHRIVHTGERPYQCAYCPKNFQRRDLMRKHERIHTDTRPYSCQYCAKAFTQRDKMVVHTRLHTGERPYVCDVCGKGFCESGNLKKHMRVHGKEPPSVMHQNNKGKPAPPNTPVTYPKPSSTTSPTSSSAATAAAVAVAAAAQQHFQQQLANEADSSSAEMSLSHVARPDSVSSPLPPHPVNSVTPPIHDGQPLHLKLQDHQQYPFSSVAAAAAAAALHNQLPNHVMNSAADNNGHHQHMQRQTATPLHDIDSQSDAGSERSVSSPFLPSQAANQHPAHHQTPQTAPAIPYHMHHSLIQHLTDMRDWYGGHLPPSSSGGASTN